MVSRTDAADTRVAALVDAAVIGHGSDVLEILDRSAPAGAAAILAARRGAAVIGLSPDEDRLELARRRAAVSGAVVDWMPGRAEDIPCPEESMDAVVSMDGVLTEAAAAEVMRVLRPGGRFVLATGALVERDVATMFAPWGVTLRFDRTPDGRLLACGRRARTA